MINIVTLLLLIPVLALAGLSPSEWAQYKQDCYNSGGSPGMHSDGSPGCCHVNYKGDIKKVSSYKAFKNYKGKKTIGKEMNKKVLKSKIKDKVESTKCRTKI